MKLLFLSIFYLSTSFRSAYQPGAPYDWEFVVGSESETARVEYLVERENGRNYYGVDTRSRLDIGPLVWNLENYKKTAKNIDTQKTGLSFPAGSPINCGLVAVFRRWGYEGVRGRVNAQIWAAHGSLEWVGNRIASTELTLSHEISPEWARGNPISFTIEPIALYKKEGKNEFWQAKIKLKFSKRKED